MTDYPWLSLSEIAKYEPEMKRLGVSKVARGRGGFLSWHKDNDAVRWGRRYEYWSRRRSGFIARTLPQYKKNPTYRRWLSLVAWAYKPDRRFG